MAKIRHTNQIDSIDDLLSDIINKGIAHIGIDNQTLNGRLLEIEGKECLNFASYSYLGLELHPDLKEGAIQATQKYGTQFPSSRIYLSLPLYNELEELMSRIFGYSVIVAPSTTLAHLSFIPSIIAPDDLIILDHLVHYTVQNPVNICKTKGTKVHMIRHNRMDILEDTIKANMNKHGKVWYMADGIYSMFGDVIPMDAIVELLNKYNNFHVYIDDAHGMSWIGEHGKGWVLSQVDLHPKMILALSLSKGFGSGGGVLVFPDEEIKRKVSTVGGSLIFTGPMSPPEIGAAVASARLHLGDDIYNFQNKLRNNVDYLNDLLRKTDLPLVDDNICPIFYIGMGLPRVGQNMVRKLIDKGCYVNLGMFPAVPLRCSGVRVSLTAHLEKADIDYFVSSLLEIFPKVLEEENYSLEKIYADFKGAIKPRYNKENMPDGAARCADQLKMKYVNTIREMNKEEWDSLLGDNGIFDYDCLVFLEDHFQNNPLERDNWKFHYFIISDQEGNPVVATFFTKCYWKDDMLAPASVSAEIEKIRMNNPDYLVSKTLTMGAMMTEGKHLFVDYQSSWWKEALILMLDKVTEIKKEARATQIVLRDFDEKEDELKSFFIEQGFLKIPLAETNIVDQLNWSNADELMTQLKRKYRYHFRKNILPYEHLYHMEITRDIDNEQLEYLYSLYLNVLNANYDLNLFPLPFSFFKGALKMDKWEYILLRIKNDNDENGPVVAFGLCYQAVNNYISLYIGLDYEYIHSHSNYRQLLYQIVKRASRLKKERLYFGLTASLEKRRLGAVSIPQVIYVQADDNYKFEKIANFSTIHG